MKTYPREQRHNRKKTGNWSKGRKAFVLLTAGVVLLTLFSIGAYFFYLLATLPRVDRLADYKPPIVSQVFGDDGSLVGEFYLERRTVVPVEKIPKKLIYAFVAAEDANFYRHSGIDYLGIVRAAFKNLMSMRKKEGASTITQQVAKSMLLTPEKKYSRKLKEAILASRMEKTLTKDEILYIYLNQIYLGAGAYGVQLAAETYFGKDVEQLNLAEMAMLAGLPKAPSFYSPIKHLDRARQRQAYVLERMVKEGYITQAESDHAAKTPITIQSKKKINSDQSAYFLEQVRIQLEEKYGEDRLYKEGLKIYTTMNADMQRGAYQAVVDGLKSLDKRQGFRGPIKNLAADEVEEFCRKVEETIDTASLKQDDTYQGVVTSVNKKTGELTIRVGDRSGILSRKGMAWAGKVDLVDSHEIVEDKKKKKTIALGSVLEVSVLKPDMDKKGAQFALDQEPLAQSALIAIDPQSGAVKAMIGGYDFRRSQFNRALQARRNAGSAFKPIIYAAAIDKGMTPASVIDDSPVEYKSGNGRVWAPRNYDNIFRGPVTMREALTNSINIASIKILENIGVGYAVDYAKKLGIESPLADNLTLALGSSSITPMELTSAYNVFASGGYRFAPYFVSKVTDSKGNILEEFTPPSVPVFQNISSTKADTAVYGDTINEANKAEATPSPSMGQPQEALQVISSDTAYIITNLMESVVTSGTGQRARALGRPVAGKTGTTNDMKDAWFVGYTPQLVAGVWVGYDQERSLGASGSGGQAAAPIWTEFMQKAMSGMPVRDFIPPPDVAFALIDPKTGKLAQPGSFGSVMECFVSGTEPTAYNPELPRQTGPIPAMVPIPRF